MFFFFLLNCVGCCCIAESQQKLNETKNQPTSTRKTKLKLYSSEIKVSLEGGGIYRVAEQGDRDVIAIHTSGFGVAKKCLTTINCVVMMT